MGGYFKDITKKRFTNYVLLLSIGLLVFGVVLGFYGFSQLGGD